MPARLLRILRRVWRLLWPGALVVALMGCAPTRLPPIPESSIFNGVSPADLAMDGIRIGVLADARFQTENSLGLYTLGGDGLRQRVDNIELRPPSLGYLSQDMLEHFLRRLIDDEGADMILYLGNGANNGCHDELDRVFTVLRKYRDGLGERRGRKVAIFYVIGNHDYLGAGYNPETADRSVYCFDRSFSVDSDLNDPVDKFELITMVHAFNADNFRERAAARQAGWAYRHSYDRVALQRACVVEEPGRYQHVKPGCFYAAKLIHPDGSEILLADSSDYHDHTPYRDIPLSKMRWYGVTGWISVNNGMAGPGCNGTEDQGLSQAQWFACHRAEAPPPVRIIAAHYPIRSLSPIGRPIGSYANLMCRLAPMLLPRSRSGDYWFSADTHIPPFLTRETIDLERCEAYPERQLAVNSLNVGSVVDYDWTPVMGKTTGYEVVDDMTTAVEQEPHAVIVSIALDGAADGERLALRKIKVDVHTCKAVIAALRRQPAVDSPIYVPVAGATDYKRLFGLARVTAQSHWTAYDQAHARQNLQKLLGHLRAQYREREGAEDRHARVCVALESARLAGSVQSRGFECESCPPWRIMRKLHEQRSAHY